MADNLEKTIKATLEESKKKKYEDSKEDKAEDKKMEKKRSMSHADWEKSEMDKKMDKKKVDEEEVHEDEEVTEETLSASTLHPAARSVSDPKAISDSKVSMMARMLSLMDGMNRSDMTDFFSKTMSQFGPNKDYGVGDKSENNKNSIDMKASDAKGGGRDVKDPMPKLDHKGNPLAVKEEMADIFGSEELSEEFMDKASTLFEAALSARLMVEKAAIEEEFNNKLEESMNIFTEELTSKLDTYLDYVVENWMSANEVAIESALRNELAEEFIDGLKGLFAQHYINLPEEKVEVVESLADKVSELEQALDKVISENNELKDAIIESKIEKIVEEASSSLTLTQREKFFVMAEGIDFDGDLDVFSKKISLIKENFFEKTAKVTSTNIEEETFEGDIGQKVVNVDPSVNKYVQAISKSIKK